MQKRTVMNTKSRLPLTIITAAGIAVSSLAGAAFAQPNTDVYAYTGTQPANGVAAGRVDAVRAPVPGFAVAYAQFGPAAAGLTAERPIVVAAPYVGRGQVNSAGRALELTGLVAGN